MDTNNENKTMNAKRNDDFQTVWERRKQNWQQQAEKTLPDDATLLRLAETARQQSQQTAVVVPLTRPRKRWIPYAAAACIAAGLTVVELAHQSQSENELPVAEEVTVEGQTIHFLCNNGCSVQDILLSANEVIK